MRKIHFKREIDDEILRLYNSGMFCPEIGQRFNVSGTTIQRFLKKKGLTLRKSPAIQKKYKLNHDAFNAIDNEEKAYWLGFLYADGCIFKGKGYSYIVKLSLAEEDKNHVEKFKNFIQSENPIYISKYSGKGFNRQNMHTISIVSEQMFKNLKELGCVENKTLILKFPPEAIVPPNLVNHFIRGYFDGDGSFGFYSKDGGLTSTLSITSTKEICSGVIEEFKKLKISCHLNKRRKTNTNNYTLQTKGNRVSVILFEYLYNNATVFLDRKKLHFLDFLKLYKEKTQTILNHKQYNQSEFTLENIKAIFNKHI